MPSLTENSIANMYGPDFLLLYGVVIAVTLGVCYWLLRNRIDSLSLYGEHGMSPMHEIHGEVLDASMRIRFAGALVIGGLGGYKLIVALSKGRQNVLFLIAMGVISLWVLFVMCPVPDSEQKD